MEQATHSTDRATPPVAPGASTEREAYRRASTVMDGIVARLQTLPRSAAVVGELVGFRVRFNFGTNDPSGIRQFVKIAGAKAVVTQEQSGAWLEAKTVVDGVEVCAEVLLSAEAAAAYEAAVAPSRPAATAPLGKSVLALVPVLSPVGAPE
ncbi:hypothetical protein [Streptomyces sp. NPDC050264]|uniref:hypothetical protein n=1 Tax=Streptomyces sp. NPDC050264 TaxID=3155038 RepID=UPI00341479C3